MDGFDPSGFDGEDAEERLLQQAEEFMRQGRYEDAIQRYRDLRASAPTDLWASLGHASALECAGEINAAERVLDEAAATHQRNAHLHRFQRLFYERREDIRRVRDSRAALRESAVEEIGGPPDQLADLFFNQGRYGEALMELERVLAEEDCSDEFARASVLARIGACLRQDGRNAEARDHLLRALELESDNHWTLAELAECERALGDAGAARERYQQALAANPDDHWCRGHLAQLEYEQGRVEIAVELYEAILAAEPQAIWALVELAQVLTERDPQRSEDLCQQALELDPSYPWAWAHLGTLARLDGRLTDAKRRFQQALEGSPNSVWILHELADTSRQMDRYEEAHAHLDHARSIAPFDATTYGYTADLLRAEGRDGDAIPHLVKAVELDPDYLWAWRELAELQAYHGHAAEAERCYREACRLDPGDPINDGLKAFLLRCTGNREAALPFLERAVAGHGDYLWAWRELAEYHLGRGEGAEAEAVLVRALERMPESTQLRTLRIECLRQQGRRDEARVAVRELVDDDGDLPQLRALAAELESDHDLARAVEHARRACELDEALDYRLLLAQILMMAGSDDEARDVLARVLEHDEAPALAYDLAAELAVRADNTAAATGLVDGGLAAHPDDPRLLIRRVRLAGERAETGASTQLEPLFGHAGPLPWAEIAQLYARDRDAVGARRACARLVEEAAGEATSRARAWQTTAETEFVLGDRRAARAAAERALADQPDLAGARILVAMLADEADERAVIREHLDHLDEQIARTRLARDEETVLLRQIALLAERIGDHARAQRLWTRLAELDDSLDTRLEHARALIRRQRPADALGLLADLDLAELAADDRHRVLAERAQAELQRAGLRAAIAAIAAAGAEAPPASLVLLAQLQVAAARFEQAQATIARLPADAADHDQVRLLELRCLLGEWRAEEAATAARALHEADPADPERAVLYAESLALQERYRDALAILQAEPLTAASSTPLALLGTCLLLELGDEARARAWLTRRLPAEAQQLPLLRILGTAWPACLPGEVVPAARSDAASLPPMSRCARRIAHELSAHGWHALAAAVANEVAERCARRGRHRAARGLQRLAVAALCRAGRRGEAWALAWRLRSASALLRCCWP